MKWNFFSKANDLEAHIKTYEFVRRNTEADIANLEDQIAELRDKVNYNASLTEKLLKQVDLLCNQITNTFRAEGLDEKALKDAEVGRNRREYQTRWAAKKRAQEQSENKKQEQLIKRREYARKYYLRKKAEREAAK
jgi:TolA-binding protein